MLSLAGITVAQCSRTRSSCSRSAVSMSVKMHALGLELLVDLVVDDLGLVLGADAGEELALGLGDAELVEGVLDVLGDLVPARAALLGGADEVVDVVEVDLVEVAAPLRGRARVGSARAP